MTRKESDKGGLRRLGQRLSNRFERSGFAFFVGVLMMIFILAPTAALCEALHAPDWAWAIVAWPLGFVWWLWAGHYIRRGGDPDNL